MSHESALRITDNGASQYLECGRINDYRLIAVYQKIKPDLQRRIIEMWRNNKALPPDVNALDRVRQVVITALGPHNNPVGVSTVYVADFSHVRMKNAPAGIFYFFRTFVQPHIRAPNMSKKMAACTFDYLKTCDDPRKPQGVIIVAENPKLTPALLERQLVSLGWQHIGEDHRGKLVFTRNF